MPLIPPGHECAVNEPGRMFERHHHSRAYAALVISGSCDEAGDRGRHRARVGDVLIHAEFDGHGDCIGNRGATFINLPLDRPLDAWFGRVADVDSIVRAYERDPVEAKAMLQTQFVAAGVGEGDWPDLLAAALATGGPISLRIWADRHGLHPASISRGFRQVYGVSPKRFRLERIASRAARRIRLRSDSLAGIAADCGFADQPHMTRALTGLLGVSPSALRIEG